MKTKYQTPSKELQSMFNWEWRRAKKILSPFLDHKKVPKFYMADKIKRGWVGIHRGRDGIYSQTVNGRWVRNAHIIAVRLDRTLEQIKHTIRHEICHVIEQNHGSRFKLLLAGLEKGREIEERLGV